MSMTAAFRASTSVLRSVSRNLNHQRHVPGFKPTTFTTRHYRFLPAVKICTWLPLRDRSRRPQTWDNMGARIVSATCLGGLEGSPGWDTWRETLSEMSASQEGTSQYALYTAILRQLLLASWLVQSDAIVRGVRHNRNILFLESRSNFLKMRQNWKHFDTYWRTLHSMI